jgi:hypothetical protein
MYQNIEENYNKPYNILELYKAINNLEALKRVTLKELGELEHILKK